MGNSGRFVGTLLACFVLCCAFFLLRRAAASPGSRELASADQVTHDGMVKTAVVSDGSSLYVAEEKHGHQVISKIVPATGEQSTVSAPFPDVRVFDVSPDHTRLLASPTRAGLRSHELWTIPLGRVPSARLADLLADDVVRDAGAEVVLKAIRQRDDHVVDAPVLDQLAEQLSSFRAVIVTQEIPHHVQGEIA